MRYEVSFHILISDNFVKSVFSKDSCDGSGLNTSENSKDSHPIGLKGDF